MIPINKLKVSELRALLNTRIDITGTETKSELIALCGVIGIREISESKLKKLKLNC